MPNDAAPSTVCTQNFKKSDRVKFAFVCATILFLTPFTHAQSTDEAASPSQQKDFHFKIKAPANKEAMAVLKLTEKKDFIYLYFEGSGLQSGKYKLIKADTCATLKKQLRSKKTPEESSELYSFETKYGNISGERNLPAKSFQELGPEHIAIAIVKIESKNNIIISCVN